MKQHEDPQRLLEQLFTASPVGVAFLDRNLRYLRVNDSMAAINGCAASEHVGRSVADIVPHLAPTIVPQYEAIIATGIAVTGRNVRTGDRDDVRHWLSSYFPVHDHTGTVMGICTIVQDITERKRYEATLLAQSDFHGEFIAGMPGLLLLLDQDSHLRHWNRQLQQTLKRDINELAGSRIFDHILAEDRLAIRHVIADCMEKGHASAEARFLASDGRTIPTSGQSVRIMLDGKPHVCVQVVDVTEQTRTRSALEDQLRYQSLVADLSATLLAASAADIPALIEQALPDIAASFDADRLVLWEFKQERNLLVPTMSWHAAHAPPVPMDMTSDDFPDTASRIFAGKPIVFSSVESLFQPGTPSRQYFEESNLRSGLMVPVKLGGSVVAMIAMATFDRSIDFGDHDVQRCQVFAGVVAGALKRHQTELDLQTAFDHIAQLKDSLEAECVVLREEISLSYDHNEIIGQSAALRDMLFRAEQVAATDVSVLVNGETGVGKELVARAIHRASRRHMKPLITINCAALPPSLIESELFGHEKGAFTGADVRRAGRFEVADGGTLFLDEIGELPHNLQAKLLRVLQVGEFERLGSSKTLTSDVRIIAATNRDLESEVAAGRFREDLWYRLNVFPLLVPPLRERLEDIPALVVFFLDRLAHKTGRKLRRVPQSVMNALQAYSWPGNVRELDNILQVLQDRRWRIEGEQGAARVLGLKASTLRARLRRHGLIRPKPQARHIW